MPEFRSTGVDNVPEQSKADYIAELLQLPEDPSGQVKDMLAARYHMKENIRQVDAAPADEDSNIGINFYKHFLDG